MEKNIYNEQAVVCPQSTREKKVLHMLIEKFLKQAKEEIIMDTVLSDEFMDKVQDNFAPIESLMAYYRCFPCNMTEIRLSLLRRE